MKHIIEIKERFITYTDVDASVLQITVPTERLKEAFLAIENSLNKINP